MGKPEQEPLLDIARGDAARSRQLRSSLKVLRERTDNPQFRKLLDDVLAGRTGLRDAARTPVFDQVVAPRVQQAVDRLREMPEDEKQRLAAEAEAQLERFRQEADSAATSPGTVRPEPSPAEPTPPRPVPPRPAPPEPPADDEGSGDGFLRPSW